jgi:hypothetical protein
MVNSDRDPTRLLADDSLFSNPMELPEAPGKHHTVYRAEEGARCFNLHSYITRYEDKFWACWSSGWTDEEGSGQCIVYSMSDDGYSWTDPGVLTEPEPDGQGGEGVCISRGIFVQDGALTAHVAHLDRLNPGVGWEGLRLARYRWDGSAWHSTGVLIDNAMTNFPPQPIGDRLLMTIRVGQRNRFYTALSEDLKGGEWQLTFLEGGARISEPSWYIDPDGVVQMLCRDRERSKALLRCLSTDNGETWSAPVITNYPDTTSKNFTLQLSNGAYCLINNPNREGRDPLAATFSVDGWTFDRPVALRKNAPLRRFAGRAKPGRSFQYPHAIEYNGSLWLICSVNKEDIEVSEYPIESLVPDKK